MKKLIIFLAFLLNLVPYYYHKGSLTTPGVLWAEEDPYGEDSWNPCDPNSCAYDECECSPSSCNSGNSNTSSTSYDFSSNLDFSTTSTMSINTTWDAESGYNMSINFSTTTTRYNVNVESLSPIPAGQIPNQIAVEPLFLTLNSNNATPSDVSNSYYSYYASSILDIYSTTIMESTDDNSWKNSLISQVKSEANDWGSDVFVSYTPNSTGGTILLGSKNGSSIGLGIAINVVKPSNTTLNGVTLIEDGIRKTTIKLNHARALDFYNYLDQRKKASDLMLALAPIPAGQVGKIATVFLKVLAGYEFFFGEQPGFDTYIRDGNQQGITLTIYRNSNAMGESTTYSIIMNSNNQTIGLKSVMGW